MVDVLFTLINFLQIHQYEAYIILLLGSYFETLIGPGFFIYGEIFFLSGAIVAGAGGLNIWIVAFVCITGGILGDTSSYLIGRKYGHRIAKHFFRKENKYFSLSNYKKGVAFIRKRGLKGIFFARLMGPLSWITPFLSGTLKIKYKDFIRYNIPGVVVGISIFLVAGYFFGYSYNLLLPKIQKYTFYGIIVIAIIVLLAYFQRLRVQIK